MRYAVAEAKGAQMGAHSYGLSWIDEDRLFEVTDHVFGKMFAVRKEEQLPPDPFTLVAQAKILDEPLQAIVDFDDLRSRNKSLSNAIGLWHQKVLGLSPRLTELGSNGGGVDLRTAPGVLLPTWGKPGYFEVKNRFNTIKASNEKDVWDKLKLLAQSNGAVSHVVQVIPRTREPYDRPWVPSGRTSDERVRCCDGVTAYAFAFDRPEALHELYRAMPAVLDDVRMEHGLSSAAAVEEGLSEQLFDEAFPKEPVA